MNEKFLRFEISRLSEGYSSKNLQRLLFICLLKWLIDFWLGMRLGLGMRLINLGVRVSLTRLA